MLRTILENGCAEAIGDYIRRARQERELAAAASTAQAAYAHLQLARRYEALVARSNDIQPAGASDQNDVGYGIGAGIETQFPFNTSDVRPRLFGSRSHY